MSKHRTWVIRLYPTGLARTNALQSLVGLTMDVDKARIVRNEKGGPSHFEYGDLRCRARGPAINELIRFAEIAIGRESMAPYFSLRCVYTH